MKRSTHFAKNKITTIQPCHVFKIQTHDAFKKRKKEEKEGTFLDKE